MRIKKLTRVYWVVVGVILLFLVGLSLLSVSLKNANELTAVTGPALFEEKGCAQCHYTDSKDKKIGPGLKGVFSAETLPASGRPATRQNVREQLKDPYGTMPSYADRLTEKQTRLLIEYLEGL